MFRITTGRKTQTVRTKRRANMAIDLAYEGRRNEQHIARYKEWIDEHCGTSNGAIFAIGDTVNGIIVKIEYIPDGREETA